MQLPKCNNPLAVKNFIDNCIIGYKTSGIGFTVFLDETNLANSVNSKKIIHALNTAWNTQREDVEMENVLESLELLIFDLWGTTPQDYTLCSIALSSESYEITYKKYATSLITSHKGLLIEHTKELNAGNGNYYLEMYLRLFLERVKEKEKELSVVTG